MIRPRFSDRVRGASIGLVLLILPSLAGCLGIGPGGACSGMTIPAPSGSSTFTYDAEGLAWLPTAHQVVVEWGSPSTEDNEPLRMPPGSNLTVAVGDRPEPRFSTSGADLLAQQVSLHASTPNHPDGVWFQDQWLGAEDGGAIQAIWRDNVVYEEGEIGHLTLLQRLETPGLFLAPLVWDQPLTTQTVWDLELPATFGNPDPTNATDHLHGEVSTLEERGNRCVADLAFTLEEPNTDQDWRMEVRYEEGTPLPTRFIVDRPAEYAEDLKDDGGMTLELSHQTPGKGVKLEPFERGDLPSSALEAASSVEGMPAGIDGFPTGWRKALDAIRDDPQAGAWLENHPAAAPTKVEHRLGAASSEVEDEWTVVWWGGPDAADSMRVTVTKEASAVSMVTGSETTVETQIQSAVDEPARPEVVPTFDAIRRVHDRVYDREVEVLRCTFSQAPICKIGTHNGTRALRVGGSGSGIGIVIPGLLLDLETGRFTQEASIRQDIVGPPAG